MIEALFGFEFMRNALLAGLLVGVTCGILGAFVVVNRIVFVSGGIAHAAYGGVGLAFFFGISPIWGVMGFSLAVSLLMAAINLKAKHRADTVIGVIWAAGMALGIILLDLTPGYNVELMSYLFGSILTVPGSDLWMMAVIGLASAGLVVYFYHDLVAMSYDDEFARVRGVPVRFLYITLMVLIGLSVVMIIRAVGLILLIAMLTIPPYIAERYARSMAGMMLYSVVLNLVFIVLGLWLSYSYNLTSGASIIMVASVGFFISRLIPARAGTFSSF